VVKVHRKASNAVKSGIKYPTEHQEQVILSVWLSKLGILHYAIPNGGSRNMLEAVNLKKEGVKRGVPDICIPIGRKGKFGLYIELKRQKAGKLSPEQIQWGVDLIQQGYDWAMCKGATEAKILVCKYLDIELKD
jgi:hypothetical protein